MSKNEKQTLELLPEMKKRWGSDLNPSLQSIKFSQTETEAVVELTFRNDQGIAVTETTNLGFITEGLEEDDLVFKPENDVVDNARSFVELDGYSIINCVGHLLHKEAEERINDEHLKKYYKEREQSK